MKPSLRFEFASIALGMLLAGCERPDTKLQKNPVGTWALSDYFEMTFVPDGSFHSKLVGNGKEATVTGNWLVSNSCVGLTITEKSDRNWSNALSRITIGNIEYAKVVSVDAVQLVMAFDRETNTYKRK